MKDYAIKISIKNTNATYSATINDGGTTDEVIDTALSLVVAAGHSKINVDDYIVQRAYEIEPPKQEKEQPDFVDELLKRYPRIHKHGFTHGEMEHILKFFPEIDMDAYNSAMICNTGMVIENDFITYLTDFRLGLYCGLDGREATIGEWD